MEKISYDTSEIYLITCETTGKKYIGQTKSYYRKRNGDYYKVGYTRRYSQHIYDIKSVKFTKGCRCLTNSFIKYGLKNHTVKIIFVCNINKANYYETKFIREYNTLSPNGLNISKGGKNLFSLSEETKEIIRQTQLGKILPRPQKNKMSESHSKNTLEGKLPPRRQYNDLPKYIYHVISSNKEGYEIRHHPQLKQKQFTAKSISMEENLKRAVKYIEENDPKNHKVLIEYQVYSDLPRYIRHVKSEKYEGFEVNYHPTLKNKKWTSMKLSMEFKLKLATEYIN